MENIKNDLENLEINDTLHLCKFCNAAEENRRCSIYPKSTDETTRHCKMFWYSEDTDDGALEYGLASDLNHSDIE